MQSLNAIPESLKAFENFENGNLVELYKANLQLSDTEVICVFSKNVGTIPR